MVLICACGIRETDSSTVVLGATTTIEDSGLLVELQKSFAAGHPRFSLRTITGGSGEILQLGRRADVDVTFTHDPEAESTFVTEGHAEARRELMYNYFLIVGPEADPAALRGNRDAVEGFKRIAAAEAAFVSRGDQSGTHRKELFLWREAGLDPPEAKPDWYSEAGAGMGDALRVASERGAYILTEPGTFMVLRSQLRLAPLVEGDPRLLNRYALMRVNRTQHGEAADSLIAWLLGPASRDVIDQFGRAQFGDQLFRPR
ncbi:MAG: substrate-binding domain-containing protein [Gemmatimonadota bacterium]